MRSSGNHPAPPAIARCLILFIGMTCLAAPAFAWGEMGHRAVARVAEHFLNDEATSAVKTLLGDMSLEEASLVADQVRNDPQYAALKPLHFAAVQEGAAHFDLARDCSGTSGCVVSAIIDEMAILRSTTATTQTKRTALTLLSHFVADVHQPLRVARASDQFGGLIVVRMGATTATLLQVWDSLILQRRYRSEKQLSEELINVITPDLRDQWSSLDPVAWADASYQYAINNAYAIPPSGVIDDTYEKVNLPVIRLRLAQAGVRLADVLNSIYAEPKLARATRLHYLYQTMPVAANRAAGLNAAAQPAQR